ncbi:DUF262 domain-containing protein [Vibrio cyclitrophicus]
MSLSYNSDPRVVFITQLLNQLSDGSIKIPRFQREFVWDWDQQRDLLCSVYEGLPIGAILMWHTNLNNIKAYSSIGPFKLQQTPDVTYEVFLMDGLQRLSTLYCTLLHPIEQATSAADACSVEVYCDLDSSDIDSLFLQRKTVEKLKIDMSRGNFMPLSCALDTKALIKFQRTIPLDKDSWIDKSEAIADAFKSYKVPVVPLESNQQEIVTKSFERINTRGTIMSETHMLNALTYTEKFDLLQQIEIYKDKYLNQEEYWTDIDSEYILSIIKLFLDTDIYNKNTEKLAKKISNDVLEEVFQCISNLVNFSKEYLNIDNPAQFPYKAQIFGLAYALKDNSKVSKEELVAWYVITTYTGAFGATARNTSNALEDMKTFCETGSLPWSLNFKPNVTRWNGNTHFRTARVKAWAAALGKRLDRSSKLKHVERDIIKTKGKVLQKPIDLRLDKNLPKTILDRAGFYFVNTSKNGNFSISNLNEFEREEHFLPNFIIGLLNDKNYEEFLKEREFIIYQWEIENIVKPAAQILKQKDIMYD